MEKKKVQTQTQTRTIDFPQKYKEWSIPPIVLEYLDINYKKRKRKSAYTMHHIKKNHLKMHYRPNYKE